MVTVRMKGMTDMWRRSGALRWFFAAHLQGALGAGAGYIALLVLAYDRIGSAWGATAVLLADFLPAMLLGPLLGAAVDRTSRLGGAIVADVIRARGVRRARVRRRHGRADRARAAGRLRHRAVPPLDLRAAAGAGRAASASAPPTRSIIAVRDTGQLLGMMLAAGLLALASPAAVLGLNAVTFAISALLLAAPARPRPRRRARAAGGRARRAMRGVLRDRFVRDPDRAPRAWSRCARRR